MKYKTPAVEHFNRAMNKGSAKAAHPGKLDCGLDDELLPVVVVELARLPLFPRLESPVAFDAMSVANR